jgi:hypothetical protein
MVKTVRLLSELSFLCHRDSRLGSTLNFSTAPVRISQGGWHRIVACVVDDAMAGINPRSSAKDHTGTWPKHALTDPVVGIHQPRGYTLTQQSRHLSRTTGARFCYRHPGYFWYVLLGAFTRELTPPVATATDLLFAPLQGDRFDVPSSAQDYGFTLSKPLSFPCFEWALRRSRNAWWFGPASPSSTRYEQRVSPRFYIPCHSLANN